MGRSGGLDLFHLAKCLCRALGSSFRPDWPETVCHHRSDRDHGSLHHLGHSVQSLHGSRRACSHGRGQWKWYVFRFHPKRQQRQGTDATVFFSSRHHSHGRCRNGSAKRTPAESLCSDAACLEHRLRLRSRVRRIFRPAGHAVPGPLWR